MLWIDPQVTWSPVFFEIEPAARSAYAALVADFEDLIGVNIDDLRQAVVCL